MSALPVELLDEASEEARAARIWYAQRSPIAAARFLNELDHAIDAIARHPQRWPLHLHGTRKYRLRRFPYLIAYRELLDRVQVIACQHGKLSRLECRIKPMCQGDGALLARYDKFFARDLLLLAEIDADTIERATALRVRYKVKTADAIHLATALNLNAAVFLTGDATLSRCAELKVEAL